MKDTVLFKENVATDSASPKWTSNSAAPAKRPAPANPA